MTMSSHIFHLSGMSDENAQMLSKHWTLCAKNMLMKLIWSSCQFSERFFGTGLPWRFWLEPVILELRTHSTDVRTASMWPPNT